MAYGVSKVDVWMAEIADEAGAMDRVLGAIAQAGGNLECVIGRRKPDKPGFGQVFVSPVKGKKVQDAAKAAGMVPADMVTLRVETPNKPGKGHDVMRAIAAAGVNVRGISMIAVGTKAVAYVGLDSKDDAERAIKAVKAAGKK
jgi:hypothetical protein